MSFQTNIEDSRIKKIITLSDIHSDIDSLIISLRDCAKVIKYKNRNARHNLYKFLRSDISLTEQVNLKSGLTAYDDSLGFEWIGESSHVVICGDILDGYRPPNNPSQSKNNIDDLDYPQVEIKILRFINALNRLAQSQQYEPKGRIIKLLGNHELMNMDISFYNPKNQQILSKTFQTNYISEKAKLMDPYYTDFAVNPPRLYKRENIFKIGNYGFNLLFEGGCGLLVKINNTICVHGRLTHKPYSYFDRCNQFIMSNRNYMEWGAHPELIDFFYDTSSFNTIRDYPVRANFTPEQKKDIVFSPLWDRINDDTEIDKRISGQKDKHGFTKDTYCEDRKANLTVFLSDLKVQFPAIYPSDVSELVEKSRIVVGHCPQNYSSWFATSNTTFKTQIAEDAESNTFGQTIYTGKANFDVNVSNDPLNPGQDKNIVFGISMECPKPNNIPDSYMYHVDVGASRAFDQDDAMNQVRDKKTEQQLFGSRTPQVLVVNRNPDMTETVTIIKSKIKNTRKFQRRNRYEKYIDVNNLNELSYDAPANTEYYEYALKYLKYKNKYLNLKKYFN